MKADSYHRQQWLQVLFGHIQYENIPSYPIYSSKLSMQDSEASQALSYPSSSGFFVALYCHGAIE